MEWLTDPQIWIALITLMALEIVLGIDNIVFISIIASKLPPEKEKQAMRLGLGLAMFIRVGLLFSLTWIIGLTAPLFSVLGEEISGRDLLLICGGLFLIGKSTREMHDKLEGEEGHSSRSVRPSLANVITQILLLDIVFSLDSVITAVGMVDELWIMITAVVVAIGIMMLAAPAVSGFVHRHPTIKVLALSFLILIGVALVAEGLDRHIPKGYIYFAMAYAVGVELINMRMRRSAPVHLHEAYVDGEAVPESKIRGATPE